LTRLPVRKRVIQLQSRLSEIVDSGETMRTFRGLIQVAGLAAAGVVGLADAASAQVTNADVGINPTYEQTGQVQAG
jgi:hypothetical protein